jgi:hypothetical protein
MAAKVYKDKDGFLYTPSTIVFNKLTLVNLLAREGQQYPSYYEAAKTDPSICAIIEKLTPPQVELLIDRIERNK